MGLLGLAFLAPVFGGSDDETDMPPEDDVIKRPPDTDVTGTAGEDTLTAANNESAFGGDGDDDLRAVFDAGNAAEDGADPANAGPELTGGEGSDRFEISVPIWDTDSGPATQLDNIGTITDIVPGENQIVLDVSGINGLVAFEGLTDRATEDGRARNSRCIRSSTPPAPTQATPQ